MFIYKHKIILILTCLTLTFGSQFASSGQQKPALIAESYYRVKWGYFDEFLELFKKNHYPILKEMQRLGFIESIVVDYPVLHAGEQYRWDIRVTTIIRETENYQKEMKRVTNKLYPNQLELKAREAQRFRLLLAHQDIRIRREDLSKW